jgi:hypothetical protein
MMKKTKWKKKRWALTSVTAAKGSGTPEILRVG